MNLSGIETSLKILRWEKNKFKSHELSYKTFKSSKQVNDWNPKSLCANNYALNKSPLARERMTLGANFLQTPFDSH